MKSKLTKAFRLMRKEGLIAYQNFLCCQSCASSEIVERFEKMNETKRVKIKGVCFYHHQDEQNFRDSGRGYLAFGSVSYKDPVTGQEIETPLPVVEVGKLVTKCLTEAGLKVEWDESEHHRILTYE